ncbi:MAG: DedA family protein [Flavobacteriales bacterium]|nr:DedA family protein [Flavobacteriales bacterium]
MDLGTGWTELGMLGLFLASFLAATILPFSSEAVLLAMVSTGADPLLLFMLATLGNTLGGLTNYAIGRWLPAERVLRWFRVDIDQGKRWEGLVRTRGVWVALLCWVPVIGDPIAIALGLFRAPFMPSAALMLLGKAARYAVLLWVAEPFVTG